MGTGTSVDTGGNAVSDPLGENDEARRSADRVRCRGRDESSTTVAVAVSFNVVEVMTGSGPVTLRKGDPIPGPEFRAFAVDTEILTNPADLVRFMLLRGPAAPRMGETDAEAGLCVMMGTGISSLFAPSSCTLPFRSLIGLLSFVRLPPLAALDVFLLLRFAAIAARAAAAESFFA